MWPFNKKSPEVSTVYPKPFIYEVEFDIEGEDVFSIERVGRREEDGERTERTLIGYYDKASSESKQWYLDCSHAKHNQFIARFRRKLGLEDNQDRPISQLRVG
jgi:hypothetical protein